MREIEILMLLVTAILVSVITWFAWDIHWILGLVVGMLGIIYIIASFEIVGEKHFVIPEFLGFFIGPKKEGPRFFPLGIITIKKRDNTQIKTIQLFSHSEDNRNYTDFKNGAKAKINADLRARIGESDKMIEDSYYKADETSGGTEQQLIALVEAALRDVAQERSFEGFMQESFELGDLFKGLLKKKKPEETEDLIEKVRCIGWEIVDIPFKDVQPDEETERIRREKYQTEVDLSEALMKAEREGIETAGTVIQALAQSYGKTKEEIQKEMKKNKKMQKEFIEKLVPLLKQKRAIEGKAYFAFENLSNKERSGKGTDIGSLVMQAIAMLAKQQSKQETNDKKQRKEIPAAW